MRHPPRRVRLHWLGAVLVAAAAVMGFVMVDQAPGAPRVALTLAHIAIGVAVLAVTVQRLLLPPSPLSPLPLSPSHRRVIDVLQGLLIAGVIGALGTGALVAVGGLWLDAARGLPLRGNDVDVFIRAAHGWVAIVLLALAGLHAVGVGLRQWRVGDVMARMWPPR